MVERNPWWKNVSGPFPTWRGPVGVKEDGGGCHYARGTVGKMVIWHAVNNRDNEGEVSNLAGDPTDDERLNSSNCNPTRPVPR